MWPEVKAKGTQER